MTLGDGLASFAFTRRGNHSVTRGPVQRRAADAIDLHGGEFLAGRGLVTLKQPGENLTAQHLGLGAGNLFPPPIPMYDFA